MFNKNRIKKLNQSIKSILISLISQFSNSIVSFIMVPLLIGYLNKETYGLWVTLVSLVGWILTSDFGIGYGFRNKVTEYLVDKDRLKLRNLFITTFQYYLIIGIVLLFVFALVLNNSSILSKHKILSLIIYLPYIIYFPFSISNQILQGLRFVHLLGLINFFRSIIWALFISFLLFSKTSNNIYYVAIGYSAINTIVNLLIVYFAIKKSNLDLPKINEIVSRIKFDKTILIGLRFFALQISSLFLFSMGNYFTFTNLTPEDTANFDTINKIYTLYMSFFNIIISVAWSEIALFKIKEEYQKLKSIYRNLLVSSIIFSLGSILIAFIAPYFIAVWTNNKILVQNKDCLPFSILISIQSVAYVGAVFMNAFEKIMPQVILSVISIILIYPLINIGFYYNLGISTAPLVSIVLLFPSVILCHYITLRLINNPLKSD